MNPAAAQQLASGGFAGPATSSHGAGAAVAQIHPAALDQGPQDMQGQQLPASHGQVSFAGSGVPSGQSQLPSQMPPQASGQVHPAEQSYPSAAGFSTAAPSHLMPSESSQGSELRQSAAPGLSAAATSDFQGAAQRILCDCSKVVVFDQQGSILFSTSAVRHRSLECCLQLMHAVPPAMCLSSF